MYWITLCEMQIFSYHGIRINFYYKGIRNRDFSLETSDISVHIENNFPSSIGSKLSGSFIQESTQISNQSEYHILDESSFSEPENDELHTAFDNSARTLNFNADTESEIGDDNVDLISSSNNGSSSAATQDLPAPSEVIKHDKNSNHGNSNNHGNNSNHNNNGNEFKSSTSYPLDHLSDSEIKNAMKVIIADGNKRKKGAVVVDEAIKKVVQGIDERVGVAPSQADLKQYIENTCKELGLDGTMDKPRLAYFNKEHKLLYVANPKCGSTSFKKFLLRLGGDTRDYSEMKNVHKEEENELLKNLWNEPEEFQEEVLKTYYTVTFVRNPLVRLVSGYRNKIVRAPADHYITIIQKIIQKHYDAEKAINWLPRKKYRPSFEQFVEYLLTDDNAYKNYHWAPYAESIQLCGMRYDLIGQLETANQQIEEMKSSVSSLADIPFPMSRKELSVDGFSSEELTTLAFSNVTHVQRQQVYALYKKEIKLLGYSVIGEPKFPYLNLADVHI